MSGFSTDTIKVYLLDVPDAVNDSYTSTLNSIVEFDPLINDDYGIRFTSYVLMA